MKIFKAGLISISLSFGLVACSSQTEEANVSEPDLASAEQPKQLNIKEEVWEQLPDEVKERVDGTWEDAKVKEVILKERMIGDVLEDIEHPYLGKEVYAIDFPTNETPTSNMIVYADKESFEYVGQGLTD